MPITEDIVRNIYNPVVEPPEELQSPTTLGLGRVITQHHSVAQDVQEGLLSRNDPMLDASRKVYQKQDMVAQQAEQERRDREAEEFGIWQAAKRGIASGYVQTATSVGTGLEYLGNKLDQPALRELGRQTYDYWQKKQPGLQAPEFLQGAIWGDKPELLKDPRWWTYNVLQMAPSFITAYATGSVGGGLAMKSIGIKGATAISKVLPTLSALPKGAMAPKTINLLGKSIPLTEKAIQRLATMGASVFGGGVGGGLEGTSTYQEILASGGTQAEAETAMEQMTLATSFLNAISFGMIYKKMPPGLGKGIVHYVTTGATEGLTEWAEEPAEAFIKKNLGYATMQEVIDQTKHGFNVFFPAALMGIGGAGATHTMRGVEKGSEEHKKQLYDKYVRDQAKKGDIVDPHTEQANKLAKETYRHLEAGKYTTDEVQESIDNMTETDELTAHILQDMLDDYIFSQDKVEKPAPGEPITEHEIETMAKDDQGIIERDSGSTVPDQSKRKEHAAIDNIAIEPINIDEIQIDPETYQFKSHVDDKGLQYDIQSDEYDPTAAGHFAVHERLDGTKYLVSGHHRFDLAKRTGQVEGTAQIMRESDGWTVEEAKRRGAELNIKEGGGTIFDWADFIRSDPDYDKGKYKFDKGTDQEKAHVIARNSTDGTYSLFNNDEITADQTYAIADTARQLAKDEAKNDKLQNIGAGYVVRNPEASIKSIASIINVASQQETADAMQTDIFGTDSSFIDTLEALEVARQQIVGELRQETRVLSGVFAKTGAKERLELARKLGLEFKNVGEMQKRHNANKERLKRLDNWNEHEDTKKEVYERAGLEYTALDEALIADDLSAHPEDTTPTTPIPPDAEDLFGEEGGERVTDVTPPPEPPGTPPEGLTIPEETTDVLPPEAPKKEPGKKPRLIDLSPEDLFGEVAEVTGEAPQAEVVEVAKEPSPKTTGTPIKSKPIFSSYDDVELWIERQTKRGKYKNKNEFFTSDEYKSVYPQIKELHNLEIKDFENKANQALKDAGLKYGDEVLYDYVSPFGVETYTGKIVKRRNLPYVYFDSGQTTMRGMQGTKWHKGFKKISPEKEMADLSKKDLVSDSGEKIKGAKQKAESTPESTIADRVKDKITKQEKLTWQELFGIADEAYGGTQAEGKYAPVDAYNAMEMGINQHILSNPDLYNSTIDDPITAGTAVKTLDAALNKIPSQTRRTQESESMQQFSTPPPLAYLANWVAKYSHNNTVLEPSAGTGNLAVFAKATGAETIVNEIDDKRRAILEQLGFDKVEEYDAEFLHSMLAKRDDIAYDTVVMNPPFSRRTGQQTRKDLMVVADHITQALLGMEEVGRLVAIVGRGMTMDAPTFKKWWADIQSKYNVRANIGFSGKLYKKYGTAFDNRMLVIDKIGPAENTQDVVGGQFDKYEDAVTALEGVRNERETKGKRSAGEPSGKTAAGKGRGAAGTKEPVLPPTDTVGAGKDTGAPSTGGTEQSGGRSGTDTTKGSVEGPQRHGERRPTTSKEPKGTEGAKTGGEGVTGVSGRSPHGEPGVSPSDSIDGFLDGFIDLFDGEEGAIGPETYKVNAERYAKMKEGLKVTFDRFVAKYDDLQKAVKEWMREWVRKWQAAGRKAKEIKPYLMKYFNERIAEEPEEGEIEESKEGKDIIEESDKIFAEYQTTTVMKGAPEHPMKLVESIAMASVRPPKVDYKPSLPTSILDDSENKGISAPQSEFVIYSGAAHSQILPNGSRKGIMNGDGTGTGKGRCVGSVIWDNFNKGRKKAVWVSQKWSLAEDAKRDLEKIGWKNAPIFSFQPMKTRQNLKEHKEGILFITYDTLKGGPRRKTDADPEVKWTEVINEWLGEDFDGVIAFDEAHIMGSAIDGAFEDDAEYKVSQNAEAGLRFQSENSNARVMYVTATAAKRVGNFGYAERLGLWGEGTSFDDNIQFVTAIAGSGLGAMESLTLTLKAKGLYFARTLTNEGVEYDKLVHELSPQQKDMYDKIAKMWQKVAQGMEDSMDRNNYDGRSKGRRRSIFYSSMGRFYNALLTAMSGPSIIKSVHKDLEDGNAPVLQIVWTGDARGRRAQAEMRSGTDIEDLDLSPKDELINFLERYYPILMYRKVEAPPYSGRFRYEPVFDPSTGEQAIDPDAVEERDALIGLLDALPVQQSILDQIINEFGPDNVAEMTGRKERFVEHDGPRRLETKRTKSVTAQEVEEFLDGQRQILIFSHAGGVGSSYHAGKDFKNQKKRIHYLIQAGWEADKAIQGIGRTHRADEVVQPLYCIVSTNLKSQLRFMATIAKRFDAMGALTRGQKSGVGSGLFTEDAKYESSYGQAAVMGLFLDIYLENVSGWNPDRVSGAMNIQYVDNDNQIINKKIPNVKLFMNRLMATPIEDTEDLFNEFHERLDRLIDKAIEQGTYNSGTEIQPVENYEILQEKVVREAEGTSTKYMEVEADVYEKKWAWEEVIPITEMFVRNKKTGKIYAAGRLHEKTDSRRGFAVIVRTLRKVNRTSIAEEPETIKEMYDVIPDQQWESEWKQALKEMPKTRKKRFHIITGDLLSVWERLTLAGQVKMTRIAAKAKSILGREITGSNIDRILQNLGAEKSPLKAEPGKVLEAVYENNNVAHLTNGWMIKRSKVSGDYRYEVVGPDYYNQQLLENMGVFIEKHGYSSRYFIPVGDKSMEVFKRTTDTHPVVRVTTTHGNDIHLSRKPAGRKTPKVSAATLKNRVKALKSLTEKITKEWDDRLPIVIVETQEQLPEDPELRKNMERAVSDVQAAVYNGELYLVADQLGTLEEAQGAILHEGLHIGLRGFFGKEIDPMLKQVYEYFHKHGGKDISVYTLAELYNLNLNNPADQMLAGEELLARLAENPAEAPSLWRKFVLFVKQWLRDHGWSGRYTKLTANDIQTIISQSHSSLTDLSSLARDASLGAPSIENTITIENVNEANKTARATSAIGARAITPRYVAETSEAGETVLDFGSGPKAIHTQMLRDKGLDATAHEFGGNVVKGVHDPNALYKPGGYDTVMASNVLNAQSHANMLAMTLAQIAVQVNENGRAVMNYPASPRKMKLTKTQLERVMNEYFADVRVVGGTKQAPLYEARKPRHIQWTNNEAPEVKMSRKKPLRVDRTTALFDTLDSRTREKIKAGENVVYLVDTKETVKESTYKKLSELPVQEDIFGDSVYIEKGADKKTGDVPAAEVKQLTSEVKPLGQLDIFGELSGQTSMISRKMEIPEADFREHIKKHQTITIGDTLVRWLEKPNEPGVTGTFYNVRQKGRTPRVLSEDQLAAYLRGLSSGYIDPLGPDKDNEFVSLNELIAKYNHAIADIDEQGGYKPGEKGFDEDLKEWHDNKDEQFMINYIESEWVKNKLLRILGKEQPKGLKRSFVDVSKDEDVQKMGYALHIYNDMKIDRKQYEFLFDEFTDEQKEIYELAKTIDDNPEIKRLADYIALSDYMSGVHAAGYGDVFADMDEYVKDLRESVAQDAEYEWAKRKFIKKRVPHIDTAVIRNLIENHGNRAWMILGTKVSPGESSMAKFGPTTKHAKQRVFKTIAEGWTTQPKIGERYDLTVKTAWDNLRMLKDELSKSIEDKQLIQSVSKLKWYDGRPIFIEDVREAKLLGYKAINHPNWRPWKWVGKAEKGKAYSANFLVTENGNLLEKKQVFAPEKMANRLNKILGKSRLIGAMPITIGEKTYYPIDGATKYNAILKSLRLVTTLFHHQAYLRSYYLGTNKHFKKELWNPFTVYKEGMRAIHEMDTDGIFLIRNGLTVGRNQDYLTAMYREQDNVIDKLVDKALGKTPKVLEFKNELKGWARNFTDFLFNNFGAAFKMQAALIEYKSALQRHPEMAPNEIAHEVALLMNGDFGGLHLQRMERDPTTQHVFRLSCLAPDWCVDTKTRIMTKTGWKYHHELNIGDEIMTYDPKTDRMKWTRAKDKYYNENYTGKMIKIKNHNRCILMTPDHTCLVHNFTTKRDEILKASGLKTNSMIPRVADYDAPEIETYDDFLIKTVGWLVTDGWIKKTKYKLVNGDERESRRGKITQSKPNTVKILKELGLKYHTYKIADHGKFKSNYLGHVFTIPKDVYKKIEQLNLDKGLNAEFIDKLTMRQRVLLYDTMMLGDGTGQGRFCGRENDIFNMTMLQTMMGKPSTFYQQEEYCWRTRIVKTKYIYSWGHHNNTEEIDFNGSIWCPSTETGFWLAEREGLVFITGNTESNIQTMYRVFSKKPLRAELHRRFWASVLSKGFGMVILGNIMLSLFDDDDNKRRLQKAWNAGRLRWLDVDVTPVYKTLYGKDATEARKYFSLIGHFRDPIKFMTSTGKAAKHKSSPMFGMFMDFITGTDWKGYQYTSVDELLGIDDKGYYKITTKYGKKGEPKGGKLRGQVSKWGSGDPPVKWNQAPSFFLYESQRAIPVPLQAIVSMVNGQLSAFDAIPRMIGAHTASTYAGPSGEAATIVDDYIYLEERNDEHALKKIRERVKRYNERYKGEHELNLKEAVLREKKRRIEDNNKHKGVTK